MTVLDDYTKLAVCAAASIAAHLVLASALERLPRNESPVPPPPPIAVRVEAKAAPEPEPEPAKQPEPEKRPPAPPEPRLHPAPRVRVASPIHAEVPHDTPPVDHPVTGPTTDTPVFGVSMESTSTAGTGPAMPVGNTTRAQPGGTAGTGPVAPLAAPVAAYEATVMPMPQGRCSGTYTDDAHQAGVEGTVVLDLIVGEDGRARDITVVSGLPHGLTEAAVAAVRACRFSPGQKNGVTVAVRVRGFKIRFALDTSL